MTSILTWLKEEAMYITWCIYSKDKNTQLTNTNSHTPTLSLSLSLSLSLFASPVLSSSLHSLHLSIYPSLPISFSLSLPLSLFASPVLSLSLFFPTFSLSIYPFLPISFSLFLSFSLCLSSSLPSSLHSLSVCLSTYHSHPHSRTPSFRPLSQSGFTLLNKSVMVRYTTCYTCCTSGYMCL